mmetsp:Transcript_718/g.2371  ORF Transcript_718/g.2371 Transcript_718/m.2371 type:complete len:202 (-) Transcript_718:24-629(-)
MSPSRTAVLTSSTSLPTASKVRARVWYGQFQPWVCSCVRRTTRGQSCLASVPETSRIAGRRTIAPESPRLRRRSVLVPSSSWPSTRVLLPPPPLSGHSDASLSASGRASATPQAAAWWHRSSISREKAPGSTPFFALPPTPSATPKRQRLSSKRKASSPPLSAFAGWGRTEPPRTTWRRPECRAGALHTASSMECGCRRVW